MTLTWGFQVLTMLSKCTDCLRKPAGEMWDPELEAVQAGEGSRGLLMLQRQEWEFGSSWHLGEASISGSLPQCGSVPLVELDNTHSC